MYSERNAVQSLVVDIINAKALKLLQDLELLQLIRLRREQPKTQLEGHNFVARYKGAMSKQSSKEIEDQLNELREGWE